TELRKKYFPYRMIPHQVWILNGRLKAVTAGEEASAVNIRAVLKGSSEVVLKEKKDVLNYDYTASIVTYAKQRDANMLFSSSLTDRIDGLGSFMGIMRKVDGSTDVINYINSPVLKMYRRALKVPNNRI